MAPAPKSIANEWTGVADYDIPGEGDVENMENWSATGHTLDHIKNICKTKGYSGFAVGKGLVDDKIFFKKVNYQLTADKLRPNSRYVSMFYICNAPTV